MGDAQEQIEALKDEIFHLRKRLEDAYRNIEDLRKAKLTIRNVQQRKRSCNEMMQIIKTYETPEGIVIIVQ